MVYLGTGQGIVHNDSRQVLPGFLNKLNLMLCMEF